MAASKVYLNASAYTANKERDRAQAVAIDNGAFVYVGDNDGAQEYIGPDTEVIDLKGKMILPSFFEGHAHYTMAMPAVIGINLAGYNTCDEYVEACRAYLADHPDLKFLRGQGYLEACFPGAGPRSEDLDRVSCDIPIVLQAETLHSLWANTAAITLAGVTAETPDPQNGKVERNEDGTPSGCFRESAQDLILNALPDFSVEQYKGGLLHYQEMCHKLGVTGSYDPWLHANSNAIEALKELDSEGKLSMRLRGAYWADPHKGPEQVDELVAARDRDNDGNLFHINAVKLFMDGVLESQTAFLSKPYEMAAGRPDGWCGDQIWDPDNMNAVVGAIDRNGMGIHVHAAGDAAVHQTLNAIEYARKVNGPRDARHCVTHIAPDNYHPWVFDYSDPKFHEPLWPEERADILDMIDSFTINQAYANFADNVSGSIEVGKSADMIVVDRDIIAGKPEDIGIAEVEETLFHGESVYHK